MFASTRRLNLRGVRESDGDRLAAFNADPRIQRTGPGTVAPQKPKAAKETIDYANSATVFVIIEVKPEFADEANKDDLFAGEAALFVRSPKNRDCSLEIALDPRWWSRGFGSEVVRWLVDYAFEQLGSHRISLGMVADNERALKLYKRVGFVVEGTKREAYWQDGKFNDMLWMELLEKEWRAAGSSLHKLRDTVA